MYPDTPSVGQLAHVISQSAAPAFLLGALAAFIASDDDPLKHRLKADLSRPMRRAAMLNRAIFWAAISSIIITVMVIVGFASAFFSIQHERGVAILFVASLAAFTVSLLDFAREVRIALSEFDHYG